VLPNGAAMELEDEHNRETEHAAAEARNFRKEAERIARDAFKRNGAHSGDRAHSFRRIATTRSDRSRPV
jgi:hypothetical protein